MADNETLPARTVPSGHVAAEDAPPPRRRKFRDRGAIKGEPNTDAKVTLSGGATYRERMIEVETNSDRVLSGVTPVAPTGRVIAISHARLDRKGKVARDEFGQPLIASRHELVLTNEAMGRLGTEAALEEAVNEAREIAAAQAEMEFKGVDLHLKVLSARTIRRDPKE